MQEVELKFETKTATRNSKQIEISIFKIKNSEKIGAACLYLYINNPKEKWAVLETIKINENYQNLEYGSASIQKIIDFCNDQDIENLYLETPLNNQKVEKFYLKNGFKHSRNTNFDYEISIPEHIAYIASENSNQYSFY